MSQRNVKVYGTIAMLALTAAVSMAATITPHAVPSGNIAGAVLAPAPGPSTVPQLIPVEGAVVELRNTRGQMVGETVTDADGRFSFRSIRPGTYTIVSERAGVGRSADSIVKVFSSRTTRTTLVLRQ